MEKVREAMKLERQMTRPRWAENLDGEGWYKLSGNDMKAIVIIRNLFPEIAALCESQANRIWELEEALKYMQIMSEDDDDADYAKDCLAIINYTTKQALPPPPTNDE
jgi:hypothetical protein